MPRRVRLALLVPLCASLAGCASRSGPADRQIDVLRADIARLRSEQDLLRGRLEALELVAPTTHAGDSPHASARKDFRVIVLRPDSDASATPPTDVDQPPTGVPEPGDARPPETVRSRGRNAGRGRGLADPENASREFNAGVELAKRKEYDRAINALTGFIVHYPDDANAADALYWIGESYYAQGDFMRAGESFEGVLAKSSRAPHAADATLRLALVYKARGEAAKARETLERLKATYPKSDAARRAPAE